MQTHTSSSSLSCGNNNVPSIIFNVALSAQTSITEMHLFISVEEMKMNVKSENKKTTFISLHSFSGCITPTFTSQDLNTKAFDSDLFIFVQGQFCMQDCSSTVHSVCDANLDNSCDPADAGSNHEPWLNTTE